MTNMTTDGKKVYYRCTEGADCSAEIFLLYRSTDEGVSLYETGHHIHTRQQHKRGIPFETKETINSMFRDGVQKPRAILVGLRNRGVDALPSKTQLANYLATMKNKEYGRHSISLGELSDWAESRRQVPEAEDDVFVCGFECDYEEYEASKFRICLSTKRLLKLGAKTKNVHADATYKLIWQGYPVLIVGYSDADRKFHPIALSVSCQ